MNLRSKKKEKEEEEDINEEEEKGEEEEPELDKVSPVIWKLLTTAVLSFVFCYGLLNVILRGRSNGL